MQNKTNPIYLCLAHNSNPELVKYELSMLIPLPEEWICMDCKSRLLKYTWLQVWDLCYLGDQYHAKIMWVSVSCWKYDVHYIDVYKFILLMGLSFDLSFCYKLWIIGELFGCLVSCRESFNPFSTKTHFHVYSAYYLLILYSFRNSCGGWNSTDSGH